MQDGWGGIPGCWLVGKWKNSRCHCSCEILVVVWEQPEVPAAFAFTHDAQLFCCTSGAMVRWTGMGDWCPLSLGKHQQGTTGGWGSPAEGCWAHWQHSSSRSADTSVADVPPVEPISGGAPVLLGGGGACAPSCPTNCCLCGLEQLIESSLPLSFLNPFLDLCVADLLIT